MKGLVRIQGSTADGNEAANSNRTGLQGVPAVVLIGLCAAVAQAFGRFTYGVLLPAIKDDLGISNTLAGFIGTLNVAAYLLGTIFVAAATSRFRLLEVLRFGFLFSIAGLILAAFAPNPTVLGLSQCLSGFGGACIWIPSPVVASDAMPPARRRFAIGLLGSGIGLGVVFTGQLSAFVRSTMGDESWRTVYVVQASIGFAVMIATFVFIGHRQGKPSSKAGLGGFSALKRMRGWIPLTMAYTSFGLMYLLVIGFLTTRLEEDSGWTGPSASLAFTLMGLAMVFGAPLFITIANRIGPPRSLAVAFTLWGVATMLILPGWTIPTFGAAIGIGLLFSAVPSMTTLYVVENTSADDYGPAFSAATLAFGLSQMVSPQLGGFIADLSGSFTLVFVLSAVIGLTGTAAVLQLPNRDDSTAS